MFYSTHFLINFIKVSAWVSLVGCFMCFINNRDWLGLLVDRSAKWMKSSSYPAQGKGVGWWVVERSRALYSQNGRMPCMGFWHYGAEEEWNWRRLSNLAYALSLISFRTALENGLQKVKLYWILSQSAVSHCWKANHFAADEESSSTGNGVREFSSSSTNNSEIKRHTRISCKESPAGTELEMPATAFTEFWN